MKDLTKGSEWLLILLFMLPMLIGNVFQQLYMVVDSIVVGQFLGKQALGSIGACFPIVFLLISLVMGLSMGASVVISQYYGAKKLKLVRKAIDTTYITMLIAGIFLSVLGPLLSNKILILMNTPADIFVPAKTFIDIFFYGLVLTFGYNTVGSVLRALGDSKTPTWYLVLATLLNSILVCFFVLILHWGIAGSALATLFAQGFSFLGLVWHINCRDNALLHVRPAKMKFDLDIFKKILAIGLPSGLQQVIVSLGMMAIIRMVNGFGTNVIAGFTAASRLDSFAIMPGMNLSLAISTFVGQNIGAGLSARVERGLHSTIGIAAIISLAISALIIICGKAMLGVFSSDLEVVNAGARYLHIAGSFYIIFTISMVYTGFFRGAGDTFVPMLLTILSMWLIRIPVAKLLSIHIGVDGIWWSFVIGWSFGLIFGMIYYLSGTWKKFMLVKTSL